MKDRTVFGGKTTEITVAASLGKKMTIENTHSWKLEFEGFVGLAQLALDNPSVYKDVQYVKYYGEKASEWATRAFEHFAFSKDSPVFINQGNLPSRGVLVILKKPQKQ